MQSDKSTKELSVDWSGTGLFLCNVIGSLRETRKLSGFSFSETLRDINVYRGKTNVKGVATYAKVK